MRRLLPLWLVAATACGDASGPTPLTVHVPANLGREVVSPERNPLTLEGALLGRKLFFDPMLSGSNTIACASCHHPERAFTDGRVKSLGASEAPLPRHTPSLANVAFMDAYFWDGGAIDLESQVFAPLASPDEMGQSIPELTAELAAHPRYPDAFTRAFADGLSLANVARAIAQYERTLISASSRYDAFVRDEPGGTLSDLEQRGFMSFREHCAGCHVPDFFTDFGYHNSGLDEVFPEAEERIAWGRARITDDLQDIGKYKTPTLRNVAETAPYMHDGRFASLEEVLSHYQHGIRASATLDERLPPGGLPVDDDDAAAIIAFLHTLTDGFSPIAP